LVDAGERVTRLRVTRILVEDLLVEISGAPRIVQLVLEQVCSIGAEVSSLRRIWGAIGAPKQHLPQLLPLLGAPVDLAHSFERTIVRRVHCEHGLVAGQAQVRPCDLLRVPTAQTQEERDLRLRRHARMGGHLAENLERLRPQIHVGAGSSLEVPGVFIVLCGLGQCLGEGEATLFLVVEIAGVEMPNLVEGTGALAVTLRVLAALEQHLHELLVLA